MLKIVSVRTAISDTALMSTALMHASKEIRQLTWSLAPFLLIYQMSKAYEY